MYDLDKIQFAIRNTLENRGLEYTEDENLIDFDSMQFISMIVELEELLDISIDDEFLRLECFSSFVNIKNTLITILETTYINE